MAKKKHQKVNLVKEVGELGKILEKALRSAAKSQEFKSLKSEVSKSFQRVSERLISAVSAAKQSEQTRRVGSQFSKVVGAGKETGREKAEQVKKKISGKIRNVSSRLSKIASRRSR